MPNRYVFADEAGDFNFSRGRNASRYYLISTVLIDDPAAASSRLLQLRRDLAWEGITELGEFHCSEAPQTIRDRVFDVIRTIDGVRIAATLLEKAKAMPKVRVTNHRFYHYAWYLHFQYAHPKLGLRRSDELLVTTATLGTKKQRALFGSAVTDVVRQHLPGLNWKTHFCPAAVDPCLQIADFCCWAIQRKWERGDERSYDLISNRICHEYDSWQRGTLLYY